MCFVQDRYTEMKHKALSQSPFSLQTVVTKYLPLIFQFHKLNEILIAIDLCRLDDGSGVESEFV